MPLLELRQISKRCPSVQALDQVLLSFYAGEVHMAARAIEALECANRKALVVGINGTKEAMYVIKAGKMMASGDYNGFSAGLCRHHGGDTRTAQIACAQRGDFQVLRVRQG